MGRVLYISDGWFYSCGGCLASARLLVSNTVLNKTVQMYESPVVVRSTIESEGYGTRELRDPCPGF